MDLQQMVDQVCEKMSARTEAIQNKIADGRQELGELERQAAELQDALVEAELSGNTSTTSYEKKLTDIHGKIVLLQGTINAYEVALGKPSATAKDLEALRQAAVNLVQENRREAETKGRQLAELQAKIKALKQEETKLDNEHHRLITGDPLLAVRDNLFSLLAPQGMTHIEHKTIDYLQKAHIIKSWVNGEDMVAWLADQHRQQHTPQTVKPVDCCRRETITGPFAEYGTRVYSPEMYKSKN